MAKKQSTFFFDEKERGIQPSTYASADNTVQIGFGKIEVSTSAGSFEIVLKDCNPDLLNMLEDLCEEITQAVREEKQKIYR